MAQVLSSDDLPGGFVWLIEGVAQCSMGVDIDQPGRDLPPVGIDALELRPDLVQGSKT